MKLRKSQLQISVLIALFIGWQWYTNKLKKFKGAAGNSEVEKLLKKVRQKNSRLRKDLAAKDVSLVTIKANYEHLKNSWNEGKAKCRRLIAELNEFREKVKHLGSLVNMNKEKPEASSSITLDGLGFAQPPKSTEGVEDSLSARKFVECNPRIPKLEAVNPKSWTGRQTIVESEMWNLKKDLEVMHNKLLEREASHTAELDAASRSEKDLVLKWKTENERLQKELDAVRVNKEADRKELIVLTKALEESLSHQEKNTECLQEVNLSSEVSNYDSDAAWVFSKQATEMTRLPKELETASSKLNDLKETHRNELKDVQKAGEAALSQQGKRYKITMATLKDERGIMQRKLNDKEAAHKTQPAAVIKANESDVSKGEEKQFQGYKNVGTNAEETSNLRTKLEKANEQLELYKVKVADYEKREINADAQLQLEIKKHSECQKKLKELIENFEHWEKERVGSVGSVKKELRNELEGYNKLRLSVFEQQLKIVLELTKTKTIQELENKIQQMTKEAKNNANAVQFLTAERDCVTDELKLARRDRNLVSIFFLVVLCVFCLWGLDMWNKYF